MLNLDGLNEEQIAQVEAALLMAVKGKVVMTAPCPKCGRARVLMEKILPGGYIRHECRTLCSYFMVWKPREPMTQTRKEANNLYAQRTLTGGIHRN